MLTARNTRKRRKLFLSRVGEEDGLKGAWPMTDSPHPSWEPDVQISRIRLVWKLSFKRHSLFP